MWGAALVGHPGWGGVRCSTPGEGPCCTHVPTGDLIPTWEVCRCSNWGGMPCVGWGGIRFWGSRSRRAAGDALGGQQTPGRGIGMGWQQVLWTGGDLGDMQQLPLWAADPWGGSACPPSMGGPGAVPSGHPVGWGQDGQMGTGIRGRPAASQLVGFGPTAGLNSQYWCLYGWGRGRLGHPAVAAHVITGHPSSLSCSHSFIKAVFLGALAVCPAAAPAPPALCVLVFLAAGFFPSLPFPDAAESPPRFAPTNVPRSWGSKPNAVLPSWALLPRACGASVGLQADGTLRGSRRGGIPASAWGIWRPWRGLLFPGEGPGAADTLAGSTAAALSQLLLPCGLLGLQENPFAGVISHQVP